MSDEQSQEISSLLSQLYSTEIEGTFYSPSIPSVKGIIQIGEPAIHKLEKALQAGKSVLHPNKTTLLRSNAVTALTQIGGMEAKAALERTYGLEKDEQLKEWIEFGIRQIETASAEKQSGVTRVRPGDVR